MTTNKTDFEEIDNINERIRKLRNYVRLPRSYFQLKHNLSADTLKKWENNNYKIKDSSIDRIIKIFKREGLIVTKEWLESGTGSLPFLIPDSTSELSRSKNNNGLFDIDPNLPDELRTAKEIEIISSFYENSIYLYVNDESMLPIYPMDSCVIGIKKFGGFIDYIGKDCIVKPKNFDFPILRRVIFEKENLFSLSVINCSESILNTAPVLMNVELEYIAPIKWIVR